MNKKKLHQKVFLGENNIVTLDWEVFNDLVWRISLGISTGSQYPCVAMIIFYFLNAMFLVGVQLFELLLSLLLL